MKRQPILISTKPLFLISSKVVSRGCMEATFKINNIPAATNTEQLSSGVKWKVNEAKSGILLPFASMSPSISEEGSIPPAQTVS